MSIKKVGDYLVFPVIIFVANLVLIWPLLSGGYTTQISSIESVFIADARFIFQNFPNITWQPYWYAGFPFHLFYTPFLPVIMVLSHLIIPSIDIASWYRIFIGLFTALAPVSLYFLARYLTKKSGAGFLAALIFSFAPSLAYLMPQVGGEGAIHGNAPWRILTLILYGEGGHIVGLFFLPLSLLFFIKSLKTPTRINILLTVIFTSFLALSNMIALIGWGVMVAVLLGVELLAGGSFKKLVRAIIIFLFSFGLAAFWFNLSFVKASLSIGTGGAAGGVGDVYLPLLPLIFLMMPVLFFLTLIVKKENMRLLTILFLWVIIFFAAGYFWFNDGKMLVPQPNRYFPEMDMAVAITLAIIVSFFTDKLFKLKFALLKSGVYFILAGAMLLRPWQYYQDVWNLSQQNEDITKTAEYQTADWLKNNTHGERVFATGTTAFWLNTFTDIPQIRGGNDGVASPWILHAVYQINTGDNAPKEDSAGPAINWLRSLNVSYIVFNTPASPVAYHDFKKPERFTNNEDFKEMAKVGGDIIYKVPLNQPSLASVVKKIDFNSLKMLKNGVDVENLQKYADYIDPPPSELRRDEVEFSWTKGGEATIKADLQAGEGVAVQVSFDPGWTASVNGKQVLIKKDVIGFMFIDPEQTGKIEIKLNYGKTWDVWLGYLLTGLSIFGLVFYSKLKLKFGKYYLDQISDKDSTQKQEEDVE